MLGMVFALLKRVGLASGLEALDDQERDEPALSASAEKASIASGVEGCGGELAEWGCSP